MITCQFENGHQASLRHLTLNVIIKHHDGILLGKRQAVPGKIMLEEGKWALLGGFMDRNETLKEAAKREVWEESGWQIDNLQLFRIVDRPNRPHEDRQNVDFVFLADAITQSGEGDQEMTDLQFFPLDNLPPLDELAFDHGEDLQFYLKYRQKTFPLPIFGKIRP